MERFIFLLIVVFTLSHQSIGQEDSLLVKKDSVYTPTVLPIDSAWNVIVPWPPYPPPCIVPYRWDTLNFSVICSSLLFESRYTAKGAKADLKAKSAQILFSGGWGGVPEFTSEKDQRFQQKYGVEFFSQGCVHMGTNEDETAYNQAIFAWLDKTYGKMWRYELRTDAIGFEAPEPIYQATELVSSASILVANLEKPSGKSVTSEPENDVWWYVLPTSGFALLLSLYWIIKRKRK